MSPTLEGCDSALVGVDRRLQLRGGDEQHGMGNCLGVNRAQRPGEGRTANHSQTASPVTKRRPD